MAAAGDAGDDGDLAAVEHSPADAVVLLELGFGVVPAAGDGQGAGAVGEVDGPEQRSASTSMVVTCPAGPTMCAPVGVLRAVAVPSPP